MKSYHPYAVATIFFWAMAFPLTRLALRHFTPLPLGFLRCLLASAGMAAIVLALRFKPPGAADLKWFLLSGALGFFVYTVAFNKGSVTVTAAVSSVVIATAPVITALLARLVYGEKLSAVKWLAMGAEFLGVGLLTLSSGVGASGKGIMWLMVSAISFSVYNLLQRRLTRTYTALQVTAYSIFAGALLLAPAAPREAAAELFGAPPRQLTILAFLALLSSALAYASWAKAISLARNTANVSNYMFLTPFLSALMAFFLAGEAIEPAQAAGGAVVLCGVFLFNFGERLFAAKRESGPVKG